MKLITLLSIFSIFVFLNACCKDKGPNQEPTIEVVYPIEGEVHIYPNLVNVEALFNDDSKCRMSCIIQAESDTLPGVYYTEAENVQIIDNTDLKMKFYWKNSVVGPRNIKVIFEAFDYESNITVEKNCTY
ncbi:MAG: hypothetical protein LRY27_01425 [Chitinophagales bacterium]|nr:hypothetical protein [Chitinophagales bacterium]